MQLTIGGHTIDAGAGESLQTLIRRLGLDTDRLSTRPIAADMAGEVFTLRYVPMREEEAAPTNERLRKAVRKSNGEISLIYYAEDRGKHVYERTLLFVFFLAARELFPQARVEVQYAIGAGLYISIDKEPALTEGDVASLREACRQIVLRDVPLVRIRMPIDEAFDFFLRDGQEDKTRLLAWREFTYFDVYRYGDYVDYFYGEMMPSTGYVQVFDIVPKDGGVLLLRPDPSDCDRVALPTPYPKLGEVFSESERWGKLLRCTTIADLNAAVASGQVRELVRLNEALHERRFAAIASDVAARGARAVLLAGPSSSGKTTSANRLSTQLRVLGRAPVLLSLDDYYIDRDKILPGPDGTIDLEHINTIDTEQFNLDLEQLLSGGRVEIPSFNFKTGRRERNGHFVEMRDDTVLVIEGLHALNPALLTPKVDHSQIFRLYVSALTTLNVDNHNRIPTTDMRLLRRLVRDYETRGASMERTLSMWDSVRAGEEKWIFPYQEGADAIFNSTLVYELAVLKTHVYPLLKEVPPTSPCYDDVISIIKFLNYVADVDVENEIPPTSILREFIGGNTFYL